MESTIVDLAQRLEEVEKENQSLRDDLKREREINSGRQKQIDNILSLLDQHERELNWYYLDSTERRVGAVINHYRDIATNQLAASQAMRDDVLSYFRAMALIVEMAGNAATHKEKDARLRGMVEMLETGIEKLHEAEFNLSANYYRRIDVFRSSYPLQEFKRRIYEQEEEINRLKQIVGEPVVKKQNDDAPRF